MIPNSRGQRLSAAFVAVADPLSDDYSADELMLVLIQECTAVLQLRDGAVMLEAPSGELRLAASTTEDVDSTDVLELDARSGPSRESYSTGMPVLVDDLVADGRRWPELRQSCLERGVLSVYSLPLRLRDRVIGSLSLFGTRVNALDADDAAVAQALADVATIGYLHEREISASAVLTKRLEAELAVRVRIEQAKGMLIATGAGTAGDALAVLETHAGVVGLSTVEVAEAVITRRLLFAVDGLEDAPAA